MRRIIIAGILVVIAVFVVRAFVKNDKPRYTISEKTTLIDGPLDAEGRIDYAAALNARLSQGVTVENNANILFWQALGPKAAGALPPEYFRLLGFFPPAKSDDFTSFPDYLKGQGVKPPANVDANDEATACGKSIWQEAEHPQVAAWLRSVESPLRLVAEGTLRTAYYNPLAPTHDQGRSNGLLSALLPNVQLSRDFARALAARALLRLGQGETDAAWADLLTCHRLSRKIGAGGTLIESLVGIAENSVANQADLAFLANAKLNAKALAKCRNDLESLPQMRPVSEGISLGDRYMFLDIIMRIDRDGMKALDNSSGSANALADFALSSIDWDPALELANQWFDRTVTIAEEKDPQSRAKLFAVYTQELKEMKAEAVGGGGIGNLLLGGRESGERFGKILVSMMLPAAEKVITAEDKMKQSNANVLLAFALARCKIETGAYPASLADLAPKYLKSVPPDLFSGQPLIYQRTEAGYRFYSVGPNFNDDDGRGPDDTPKGDDLCVEMPLPRK